ncbi:MAG: dephospho-CoA kinase [Nocardiaceae bacterium]|nr:dephospho-CoA kinase [Nocardiaceae bacterium]
MLRVGLTGGMGAGKSTVADVFAKCGAVIIDSDRIAREVVEPGSEGLAAVVAEFGESVLSADGSLNRPALAAVAFATDESRQKLNSILHPRIGRRTAHLLGEAAPDAVVVQDIPLLVENGLAPLFHLVVIVDADVEVRVRRLVEHRGVDEADARVRIAAQATLEQRRAVADVWLDNSGAPDVVASAAEELWRDRIIPFERNVREHRAAAGESALTDQQVGRLAGRLNVALGGTGATVNGIAVSVPESVAEGELEGRLGGAGFPKVDGAYRNADPALPVTIDVTRA